MPVYSPAFAGTHLPTQEGWHAELALAHSSHGRELNQRPRDRKVWHRITRPLCILSTVVNEVKRNLIQEISELAVGTILNGTVASTIDKQFITKLHKPRDFSLCLLLSHS